MIALDVHAHLAPIQPERLARLPGIKWNSAEEALQIDGHKVGIKDLFHPGRLIARMDRDEIRHAHISIPPPLYRQQLAESDAREWARYVNEELRTIAVRSDGRLSALFHVPLEHPGLFVELRADYAAGGFAGFAIAAGGHSDIIYSRPEYEALWRWFEAEGAFVFMHPGTCADARLAQYYLENLLGNPLETGVAATHLIMAGIPQRFPAIRFCLAHAGGIFSSLIGRLERGFETVRPGVDLSVERPLQAARRFYVDGIAHHPSVLRLAADMVGDSHVLYGSDWPFPMGLGCG